MSVLESGSFPEMVLNAKTLFLYIYIRFLLVLTTFFIPFQFTIGCPLINLFECFEITFYNLYLFFPIGVLIILSQ